MAKKKPVLSEDDRMGQLFNNVATKYGGMNTEELVDNCSGFAIPYYSERYVRDSNVYITGKIEMYVGGQGSGKTSYGFHVANQFIDMGGYFFMIETENKLSPVSMEANLGTERFKSGRVQFISAGSVDMAIDDKKEEQQYLQSWQSVLSGIIKMIRDQKLHHLPVYILVDSLLGASGSESRKEYEAEGQSAGRSTSDMARAASITRFLSNLVVELKGTNILVGFTNHGKTKIQMGGMPVVGSKESIPGGDSIGFHCSLILWFSRGGKEGDVSTAGRNIKIGCFKNSFGGEERKVYVGFRYDHIRDAEGNVVKNEEEEYTRVVRWNWHEATGGLLRLFCHRTSEQSPLGSQESRHLINLTGSNKKLVCPELEVREVDFEALGRALEQHPGVEHHIRSFPRLGICQYPVIEYEEG